MANQAAPALMLREGDRQEVSWWTGRQRCGRVVLRARIVLAAAAGEENEQRSCWARARRR